MSHTFGSVGTQGMLVADADGRITHVAAGSGDQLGYKDENLVGSPLEWVLPGALDAAVLRERMPPRTLLRARASDGRALVVSAEFHRVSSRSETLTVVSFADAFQARSAGALAAGLVEAAPDPILLVDSNGLIRLASSETLRVFGYTPSELLDRSIELLVPERFRVAHAEHRRRYGATPRPRLMHPGGPDLVGRRKDGTEFPAEVALNAMHTEEGMIFITIVRDISDRRRAEEEHTRLAQAEAVLRVRDEFLSLTSHELRTPVTALLIQLELITKLARQISDQPLAERFDSRIQACTRATARLNHLIDELLDLTRMSTGLLPLELEDVDLRAVVGDVVDLYASRIAQAGVAVNTHVPSRPVWGHWDASRLEQVVSNLLSNALKYGLGRPIEIAVCATRDDARIAVRDQGVGIAPADQHRVFERFERLAPARHESGFGVGLWVTRRIVEAHGGRIELTSAEGLGSTFTVILRRRAAV